MTPDASTADLGYVTVTRDFDAPREVVFGAFMDPGQLARFWGPTGTHVPPESVVIEPFAGGRFEATIVADGGVGSTRSGRRSWRSWLPRASASGRVAHRC